MYVFIVFICLWFRYINVILIVAVFLQLFLLLLLLDVIIVCAYVSLFAELMSGGAKFYKQFLT